LKNSASDLERHSLAEKARKAISRLKEIGFDHGRLMESYEENL